MEFATVRAVWYDENVLVCRLCSVLSNVFDAIEMYAVKDLHFLTRVIARSVDDMVDLVF